MGISSDARKGVAYINGRKIEFEVVGLTLEAQYPNYGYRGIGGGYVPEPTYTNIEITGLVRNIIEKDNDMCERACGYEGDCESSGESLSAEFKKLELEDGRRKLIERGILNLNGTLTKKGESFFLNVLLDEDAEENLVEALDAIDEAKEQKKSCE